MNSTGRPRMPLPLMSLEKSSAARLAWIPYWALLPESAVGIPILIGPPCAHVRRRNAGTPRLAPTPPATATCRKSRLLMMNSPCSRGLGHPEDRRHLAELPPELAPGVAAVVAAIEIAIPAGGQDRIGRRGRHAHGPHGRVGLHGKSQALPGRARVPRAHHRADAARRRVSQRHEDRSRIIRLDRDAARVVPGEDLAGPRCLPGLAVIGAAPD